MRLIRIASRSSETNDPKYVKRISFVRSIRYQDRMVIESLLVCRIASLQSDINDRIIMLSANISRERCRVLEERECIEEVTQYSLNRAVSSCVIT